MKRKLLGISAVGLSVLAIAFVAITTSPEKQYVPRTDAGGNMEAAGATAYLHRLRANQVTGEINQMDVMAALQQLDQMSSMNKAASLGLNWESKGPDNRGGRTRAFIIDRTNNNLLYTASVAGGIFKSTNAGLSWVPISDDLDNMAVVSLTQTANGDLYAGTGEGMYAPTGGNGSATSTGMTGGGIFKSTDAGLTWTSLSTTVPPANNNNSPWSAVGSLGADPTNAGRVYAGTGGGLRRSDDGGATWTNPIGQTGVCSDLSVAADGSVWASLSGRTFYSPNGNDNSWVEISKSIATSTDLPRANGRQKYSISAQDPNTVYCVQTAGNQLGGLYRSYDRGVTWELIQAKTALFDPLCASQCQGVWDLTLGVSPHNKDHIFLAGITIWEWKKASGWRQVDSQFIPQFNVHSDKHTVTWDPLNANIVYVTSDGGVHKSSDGGFTWQDMNKNYTTTQFYHMGIGHDRKIIGGTQDNGSWLITGNGNTPNTGTDLGGVDFFSGDGGFSFISWLDNEQMFTEYQYGRMGRSGNGGASFSSFWDSRIVPATGTPGAGSLSAWMLPYYLYETTNDPMSHDSVFFKAYPSVKSEGFANGDTTFTNTLTKAQASGQFVPESFKAVSGGLVITSNAQGVLSGAGYGTFNAATGTYDVTFTTVPLAEVVMSCEVEYPNGAVIKVGSNINELPFNYALTQHLDPFDSVKIQDPVQSIVVAGLSGAVWMTRMAHNWSEPTKWWKIASMGGTSQSVTMSADGNYAWVGTENGSVIRISNLDMARSLETADIDQGTDIKVTYSIVKSFSGRAVTNIAVDPNNPDRVAVTLGNYGNTAYIYYSDDATSATPTFVTKQGNMPAFPVYSVTFDKGNAASLIIGTEYGVFSTENINAASPTWTEENNGIPRVPVFTLTQYRTNESSLDAGNPVYEGDIFAGTHARGFFSSGDLKTARPVSVKEETAFEFSNGGAQLKMYPNPATEYTNVLLNINKTADVAIFVRDINGKVVKQMKLSRMPAGKQEIRINTSDLAAGSYILTLQQGDNVNSGKFVVTK